jgi:hypothetical protein
MRFVFRESLNPESARHRSRLLRRRRRWRTSVYFVCMQSKSKCKSLRLVTDTDSDRDFSDGVHTKYMPTFFCPFAHSILSIRLVFVSFLLFIASSFFPSSFRIPPVLAARVQLPDAWKRVEFFFLR